LVQAMRSVRDLLALRSALAKKNIPVLVKLITKIDASAPPPAGLMPKFQKELMLAKTITHVVRMQSKLEEQMAAALEDMVDASDCRKASFRLMRYTATGRSHNPNASAAEPIAGNGREPHHYQSKNRNRLYPPPTGIIKHKSSHLPSPGILCIY